MVDLSDFKVSNYPDGHKHIVSTMDLKGDTRLTASIRNFDDLFLVAQVRRIHPEITGLHINYLLAGRCDRRFSPGEAIDLEIVCNYINSLSFDYVTVLKPHSYATLAYLKNAEARDRTKELIDLAITHINTLPQIICFIAPDRGAGLWVYDALRNRDFHGSSFIQGSKRRNEQGVVANVTFDKELPDVRTFIIVDDLCDGGKTFTEIAKEIHLRSPNAKVYLVVTHAIFSKGFTPFEGLIEHIYCTNSFADFDHPLVTQVKL